MGLLDIKPHIVSKDLRGYSVLFYGPPKIGKTTISMQFPNSLLLAAEKGYSAIPGIFVQPINRWSDFLNVLRELKTPEVQAKFETIVLDTADILFEYCEQYICSIEGVNNIKDIPFGQGFAMVAKEFDTKLRQIVQMNYGLVMISHELDKTFKNEDGTEFNKITPTLPAKAKLIVSRMTDIIGYIRGIDTPEGHAIYLFLRGTTRFDAGSRFKYIPERIVLTYENLVAAIASAIDKQAVEHGNKYVSETRENIYLETTDIDFDQAIINFNAISGALLAEDANYYVPRIVQIVESHLGKGKKVAECSRDQGDAVQIIADELNALAKKPKIVS